MMQKPLNEFSFQNTWLLSLDELLYCLNCRCLFSAKIYKDGWPRELQFAITYENSNAPYASNTWPILLKTLLCRPLEYSSYIQTQLKLDRLQDTRRVRSCRTPLHMGYIHAVPTIKCNKSDFLCHTCLESIGSQIVGHLKLESKGTHPCRTQSQCIYNLITCLRVCAYNHIANLNGIVSNGRKKQRWKRSSRILSSCPFSILNSFSMLAMPLVKPTSHWTT
jgi:hypothetical protein